MAEKRMFAKTIIDSDAFLDMPVTARLLYYDLAMRADDDGFVNNPKKIMREIGASQDDLTILGLRKFIIPFDSGVVVIKHWRIHNYIRKDTYTPTPYTAEMRCLGVDESKAYTLLDSSSVDGSSTARGRLVDGSSTQIREEKRSSDKLSKGENKITPRHKYGRYQNVLLPDEEITKLKEEFPNDWNERIERLSEYMASSGKSYKSPLATIRSWARKDAETKGAEAQKQAPSGPPSFDMDELYETALKRTYGDEYKELIGNGT